ncbi:unnamed protein product [Brassica rapa]|uniref:Uncharacterized protein n=1 Tax=Brassica campestris TaxID=3711 RepID=A0A3P5Y3M8_BRACM|nr:unnamed protein product [Brassica rapa]VDC61806.1 unnamed protein product [Brassica rapa]
MKTPHIVSDDIPTELNLKILSRFPAKSIARGDKLFPHYASVVGVISTGEIVLSMADYTCTQPLNVESMSHSHY